jgi:hypothetical protein
LIVEGLESGEKGLFQRGTCRRKGLQNLTVKVKDFANTQFFSFYS